MDDALTLNRRQQQMALLMALVGAVAPVLLATLDGVEDHSTLFFLGAAIGGTAPVLANLLTGRWRALGTGLRFLSIPALTLMQAVTGGIFSPHAVLLVMAMLYLAIRCTTRQLLAGVVLTLACCYLPMLAVGAPLYPVSLFRATEVALVPLAVALSFAYVSRQAYLLTRKLNQQASTDPLTRLLNRRGWEEEATRATARAAALERHVTLVLLDLDSLKQTNDTLGHEHGDSLIRDTGARLRAAFRERDAVLARLGGDEFAVLLTGTPETQVRAHLATMRAGGAQQGDFSAGIAVARPAEPLSDVMRRADLALYTAKTGGRGRDELAPGGPGTETATTPMSCHRGTREGWR